MRPCPAPRWRSIVARLSTPLSIWILLGWLAVPLAPAPAGAQADDDEELPASETPTREPVEYGYLTYSAGVSIVPNQNLWGAGAAGAAFAGSLRSDPGYNVSGAIGTRFLDYFRAELEVGYRENDVDNASVTAAQASRANGTISLLTAMVNGFAEYDLGIGVIPYVGAGVGYGRLDIKAENTGNLLRVNGKDSVFAYSAMLGASVPVGDYVELVGGYRYFGTTDSEVNGNVAGTGAQRFDTEYDAHEISFGMRMMF